MCYGYIYMSVYTIVYLHLYGELLSDLEKRNDNDVIR